MQPLPDLLVQASRLFNSGRPAEAEPLCREVLRRHDGHPVALYLLGAAVAVAGRSAEAVEYLTGAAASLPGNGDLHWRLGMALGALDRWSEALAAFRRVDGLTPGRGAVLGMIGVALAKLGRWDEALEPLRQAVACDPANAGLFGNLGHALGSLGRIEDAVAAYDRAVALDPRALELRKFRQLYRLMLGDFARGWDPEEFRTAFLPHMPGSWDGGDMAGRTLLVHNIEGFGDALHFCRYVPLIAARGVRIVMAVEAGLTRLMASLRGVDALGVKGRFRPPHHARTFFQQLPWVLGTRLDSIPAQVPYLAPDPALVAAWSGRLGPRTGLRVGLVWAGGPTHPRDAERSMPLAAWTALADIPGLTVYALQKGAGAAQLAAPPPALAGRLVDLGRDIADFADTAAAVRNLDVVVAVDTSIVHLCGAIGTPAWCLLSHVPDFRWLLEREDSPWYPTMRLFRQAEAGQWPPVVERVVADLARLAAGDRSVLIPRQRMMR